MEIWTHRLQPLTKRPFGEPVRLYSPPGERFAINTGYLVRTGDRAAQPDLPAIGSHGEYMDRGVNVLQQQSER